MPTNNTDHPRGSLYLGSDPELIKAIRALTAAIQSRQSIESLPHSVRTVADALDRVKQTPEGANYFRQRLV